MEWLEVVKDFLTPVSVGIFMLYINNQNGKREKKEDEREKMWLFAMKSINACMSLALELAEIIRENHDVEENEAFQEKFEYAKKVKKERKDFMEEKAAEKFV